jgi:hypothetical protein
VWKQSIIATLAVLALGLPGSAHGGEYDDFEDAHPLRFIAYPLHAVGYGLERLITRPIHRLVSRPGLAPIFGHTQDDFSFDRRPTSLISSGSMTSPRAFPAPVKGSAELDTARLAAEQAQRAAEAAAQAAEKSARSFDRSLLK